MAVNVVIRLENIKITEDIEQLECAICREGFDNEQSGDEVIKSSCCGKVFHNECLMQWFKYQLDDYYTTSCPSCRLNFEASYDENTKELIAGPKKA